MKRRIVLMFVLLSFLGGCVRNAEEPTGASEPAVVPTRSAPPDLSIERTLPTAAPGRARSSAVIKSSARSDEPDVTSLSALAAGVITGIVTDVNEDPISGVCVKLRDAGSRDIVLGETTHHLTDDRGVFGLMHEPGRYEVIVDATCGPGSGTYTSTSFGGRTPVVVDVREAGATDIVVVLKAKGRLVGTITDPLGAPLVGACLAVSSVDAAEVPVMSEGGAFNTLLDEGRYTVRFSVCGLPAAATDWIPEFYDDALTVEDATPVFVRAGRTETITAGLSPAVIVP